MMFALYSLNESKINLTVTSKLSHVLVVYHYTPNVNIYVKCE